MTLVMGQVTKLIDNLSKTSIPTQAEIEEAETKTKAAIERMAEYAETLKNAGNRIKGRTEGGAEE